MYYDFYAKLYMHTVSALSCLDSKATDQTEDISFLIQGEVPTVW